MLATCCPHAEYIHATTCCPPAGFEQPCLTLKTKLSLSAARRYPRSKIKKIIIIIFFYVFKRNLKTWLNQEFIFHLVFCLISLKLYWLNFNNFSFKQSSQPTWNKHFCQPRGSHDVKGFQIHTTLLSNGKNYKAISHGTLNLFLILGIHMDCAQSKILFIAVWSFQYIQIKQNGVP